MLTNCTCCIIKPHLLREKKAGQVVQHILDAGFEISAMQMFYLDKPTAVEFLEVYKVSLSHNLRTCCPSTLP